MIIICSLILLHFLVAILATDSSAATLLDPKSAYVLAVDTVARAQSEAVLSHFDSPLVRLCARDCERNDIFFNLSIAPFYVSRDYLLAADMVARAHGETASCHFDSSRTQLRVNTNERERMLSKVIGVRMTVQPLRETANFQKHVRQVKISHAFAFSPPFGTLRYFDQHGNMQHTHSSWPFFFSIAPSHYDAYMQNKIPTNAVDLVSARGVFWDFKMLPSVLATARNLREQAMRARFFPPLHRSLSVSTSETITHRLMLPLDKPFHPKAFSHPSLDLGDILKIINICCARQELDFFDIYHQIMPSVYIVPVYTDPAEECRFSGLHHNLELVRELEASKYFVQMLTGPTFRFINAFSPFIYIQQFDAVGSDVPWPSLNSPSIDDPQIILSRCCDLVTNPKEQPIIGYIARFRPLCRKNDGCNTALPESMVLAKKVWLDIEIPANTPEKLHVIAAVAELRRLSVHVDVQKIYQMATETDFSTTK